MTGDKQETAINIGYSCQLLTDDLAAEPFIVDGISFEVKIIKAEILTFKVSLEFFMCFKI